MGTIVFNFYYAFINYYFYYHIIIYQGYILKYIKVLTINLIENHPSIILQFELSCKS
jgi:hypothetical protein